MFGCLLFNNFVTAELIWINFEMDIVRVLITFYPGTTQDMPRAEASY